MFINFCVLLLFLNAFSIPLYIINPIIPPRVLVIKSVISNTPIAIINWDTSIIKLIKKNKKSFFPIIHRLNKMVEEVLYPAMESGVLDIIIGKGPSARTIQLELPPFTLIAATTRIALLSSPLRSRFSGGVFRLEFYNWHNFFIHRVK